MRREGLLVDGTHHTSSARRLRAGDVVDVRSAQEILATLDSRGSLDSVPFMPEMLNFVGKRFTVSRRVEKICDTIAQTGSRRMVDTVYLEDLRCDGSGHAGCQAGCRIYWKEDWLQRVEEGGDSNASGTEGVAGLEVRARSGTREIRTFDRGTEEVWRCQATDALKASTPLKVRDVRQYWRELTARNVGALHLLRVIIPAVVIELRRRLGRTPPLPLAGDGAELEREPLNLRPGDLVRVRPKEEIAESVDAGGHNRGLSFDYEMLPYCGRTLRVRDRVSRLVDDRTGRMIEISRDCVVLDGAVCSGERTVGCWFCPRQIFPYWREAWLERVEQH